MQTMQQVQCTYAVVRELASAISSERKSPTRETTKPCREETFERTLSSKAQVPQRPTVTIILLREVTPIRQFQSSIRQFLLLPTEFLK